MKLMGELEEQLNQIFCGLNANNNLFNHESSLMKYRDSFLWAERKARELRTAGIVQQEQIAVIGPNCPETLLWTIANGINRCSTMLINPDTDQATVQSIMERLSINHIVLNNQIQSRSKLNNRKETDLGELDRPFISILSSGTTGIGKIINRFVSVSQLRHLCQVSEAQYSQFGSAK